MAAPSTVYKDYMTRRRKGGSPNVDIDLYVAKFLQNTTAQTGDDWGDGYFNAADIPPTAADWSAANAKIKSIFKVDGFLCVPKGTTENGFIGFCYSRTSGNGLYHKTERFSGVRVPTTVNASAELLNDGGLNRKADIEIVTADPHWANWINLDIALRSAYYTSTTDYGYSWKIGAGSYTDVSTSTGSLAPKLPRAERVRGIFITGLDYLETIYFKPWTTNEEGTFYGAETYFTAGELLWTDGAFGVVSASGAVTEAYLLFATAADAAALSSVTTSDASTGIFLYLNEYFVSGNLLPTGYYVIGAETTKAYYVVNGEVRKYETRTPATASVRFSLINLGVEEYPEWRVIAQAIDAASGFPNTLTVATVVTYYTESGGTYTQTGNPVNVDIDLTTGDFNAQSALALNPPPAEATYARVTTSEAGIGLAVISPYVAI